MNIVERIPGIDPELFWSGRPAVGRWRSMVDKYEELARIAQMPDDPRRKAALRDAARRWPGSLREAELIGPERVDLRLREARHGSQTPGISRLLMLARGPTAAAVSLWDELHELLADQLRFRRIISRSPPARRAALDMASFAAWVADTPAAPRWPAPARLVEIVGPRLGVRSAYLWLAARAGTSLPALNVTLLARAGHWDRREADPSWAHEQVENG